jgi:hypothetical protein
MCASCGSIVYWEIEAMRLKALEGEKSQRKVTECVTPHEW